MAGDIYLRSKTKPVIADISIKPIVTKTGIKTINVIPSGTSVWSDPSPTQYNNLFIRLDEFIAGTDTLSKNISSTILDVGDVSDNAGIGSGIVDAGVLTSTLSNSEELSLVNSFNKDYYELLFPSDDIAILTSKNISDSSVVSEEVVSVMAYGPRVYDYPTAIDIVGKGTETIKTDSVGASEYLVLSVGYLLDLLDSSTVIDSLQSDLSDNSPIIASEDLLLELAYLRDIQLWVFHPEIVEILYDKYSDEDISTIQDSNIFTVGQVNTDNSIISELVEIVTDFNMLFLENILLSDLAVPEGEKTVLYSETVLLLLSWYIERADPVGIVDTISNLYSKNSAETVGSIDAKSFILDKVPSDTLFNSELISYTTWFNKDILTNILLTESFGTVPILNDVEYDTSGLTDSFFSQISKNVAETIGVVDPRVLGIDIGLSETVYSSLDSYVAFDEALSSVESFSNAYGIFQEDTIYIALLEAESLTMEVSSVLKDTSNILEYVYNSCSKVLSDLHGSTDTLYLLTGKVNIDPVDAYDTPYINIQKLILDSVSVLELQDIVGSTNIFVLEDILILVNFARLNLETVSGTDYFSTTSVFNRSIEEDSVTTATDSCFTTPNKILNETITLSELVEYLISAGIGIFDTVNKVEGIVLLVGKITEETLNKAENIGLSAGKIVADVSTTADVGELFLQSYVSPDYIPMGYVGSTTAF